MVFCAYCGKSFTRKEHLERHIPSHTNVKPHRCSACQLSFARRDLLQRHHATYHEARDPVESLPGAGAGSNAPGSGAACGSTAPPTVAGRTPIACQNCANAKTGCDKRVPCARCAEKSLPCAARFARRSSKVRGGSASATASAASTGLSPYDQCPLPPAYYPYHAPTLSFADACGLPPPPETGSYDLGPADPGGLSSPLGMDAWPPYRMEEAFAVGGGGPPPYAAAAAADMPWDYPMLGLDMDAAAAAAAAGLVDDCLQLYANPLQLDMVAVPAAPPAPTAPMAPEPFLAPPPQALPLPPPTLPFAATPSSSDVSPGSEPMTAASSSSWASSPMQTTMMQHAPAHARTHTRGASILSWSGGSSGEEAYGGYGETMVFLPAVAVAAPAVVTEDATADVSESMEDAEAVDDAVWPLARCTPFAARTRRHLARDAVERLQQQLQRCSADVVHATETESDLPVAPLTPQGHDALWTVLHGAVERVRIMQGRPRRSWEDSDRPLPLSHVLDGLLRAGVQSLARYGYDLLPTMDPNALLLDNGPAAQCLVLLLLAHGAASVASSPLSAQGLAEVGRVALVDMMADGSLRSDPTVLWCALLSTQLGAWSGDAGQMEAALGARSTILRTIQHAGLLERQDSPDASTDMEQQWQAWRQHEAQNRLIYGWVCADQELSLFYDTAPALRVDALRCPLPSADALWQANSASDWQAVAATEEGESDSPPPSLHALFQTFLHNPDELARPTVSPPHLRLLLYPLQGLVLQLGQMLSLFSADGDDDPDDNATATAVPLSRASIRQQLEDAKALLDRWSALAGQCRPDAGTRVLYHLIILTAMADIPAIEDMARKRDQCPRAPPIFRAPRSDIVAHCGHVLRLLRRMPTVARPAWWSVAMYRAVLLLWADSVDKEDEHTDNDTDDDDDDDDRDDRDDAPRTPAEILRDGANRLQGARSRLGVGLRRRLLALAGEYRTCV